jgi:hypothetical protein
MMFFVAPPPAPVSFSRDVAPIMAMYCNTCHGESGGISTRSYRELMLGGDLGKVIVPGDPERSLLIHFLDGRRGENRRMPKASRPLSEAQIGLIRRWIAEGAKNDDLPSTIYRVKLAKVEMRPSRITRIFCRVNTEAYLVLTMRDPGNDRVLWSEIATVKKNKEPIHTAEPGELMSWDLRAGAGWPETVTVELAIEYAASEPVGTELYVTPPPER